MSRRLLLLCFAVFLATFSLSLYLTGGFVTSILGVRVSARSPIASAIAAVSGVALWLWLARRARSARADLAHFDRWMSDHASWIVIAVASLAAATAVRYSSFSATGSDASGYLSHSLMLTRLQLGHYEPLTTLADWANAAATLTPLGWRASVDPAVQAPSYPIGLPLLMLPLHATGGTLAACLVVPLSFALAVWATGTLARRVSGAAAGILAAVWLATSPVAVMQALQPMSDVPAMAAWLLCWVLVSTDASKRSQGRGAVRIVGAGVAAAIAVLIRPNLAPLAVIPALWLSCAPGTWRRNMQSAAAFSVPVAAAGALIAYLYWRWFGSPLRSGHGTAQDFFALANVAPNIAVYTRWLFDTHGPWLLAAPLAFIWPGGRLIRWLLVFAAAVVAAYLVFGIFDVWIYLRFLLPALAVAMIAVAAIVVGFASRVDSTVRAPMLVTLILAIAFMNLAATRSLSVVRIAASDSRAALAGRYLDTGLPPTAVVMAGEQSGSLRYYTGRSIVRWDVLSSDAFAPMLDRLQGTGHEIWVVLDAWEEELFRRKFPGAVAGPLDWPPRLEAGTEALTRAWRLRDRELFIQGGRIVTDRLR